MKFELGKILIDLYMFTVYFLPFIFIFLLVVLCLPHFPLDLDSNDYPVLLWMLCVECASNLSPERMSFCYSCFFIFVAANLVWLSTILQLIACLRSLVCQFDLICGSKNVAKISAKNLSSHLVRIQFIFTRRH